jgi:hypothetical protein
MHKRDLLMRQFEEFGKFLATILGYKQQENFIEVSKLINDGALKYIGISIGDIEDLDEENLIIFLTQEKKLTDEQLKMLADLLYEKGINDLNAFLNQDVTSQSYFKKAQLLYDFVNKNATLPYSLDTHYKLEAIKEFLK